MPSVASLSMLRLRSRMRRLLLWGRPALLRRCRPALRRRQSLHALLWRRPLLLHLRRCLAPLQLLREALLLRYGPLLLHHPLLLLHLKRTLLLRTVLHTLRLMLRLRDTLIELPLALLLCSIVLVQLGLTLLLRTLVELRLSRSLLLLHTVLHTLRLTLRW